MKGDELPGLGVNSDPDPLLVSLAPNETPHFIGLRAQAEQFNVTHRRAGWRDVEIIRQRLIKFSDEGQQPAQTDIHHAADAAQRETFEQQSLDAFALVGSDPLRVGNELSTARWALMILFAVVSVTILLDV